MTRSPSVPRGEKLGSAETWERVRKRERSEMREREEAERKGKERALRERRERQLRRG